MSITQSIADFDSLAIGDFVRAKTLSLGIGKLTVLGSGTGIDTKLQVAVADTGTQFSGILREFNISDRLAIGKCIFLAAWNVPSGCHHLEGSEAQ